MRVSLLLVIVLLSFASSCWCNDVVGSVSTISGGGKYGKNQYTSSIPEYSTVIGSQDLYLPHYGSTDGIAIDYSHQNSTGSIIYTSDATNHVVYSFNTITRIQSIAVGELGIAGNDDGLVGNNTLTSPTVLLWDEISLILYISQADRIRVYNPSTRHVTSIISNPQQVYGYAIALSPDRNFMYAVGNDKSQLVKIDLRCTNYTSTPLLSTWIRNLPTQFLIVPFQQDLMVVVDADYIQVMNITSEQWIVDNTDGYNTIPPASTNGYNYDDTTGGVFFLPQSNTTNALFLLGGEQEFLLANLTDWIITDQINCANVYMGYQFYSDKSPAITNGYGVNQVDVPITQAQVTFLTNTAPYDYPYDYGEVQFAYDPTTKILYFTERGGYRINAIDMNVPQSNQTVTTVIGGGTPNSAGNANGQGFQVHYASPFGLAKDAVNNQIYITDQGNNQIRSVSFNTDTTTTTTTIPIDPSLFTAPSSISYDSNSNTLYTIDNQCILSAINFTNPSKLVLEGTCVDYPSTIPIDGSAGSGATSNSISAQVLTADGLNIYLAEQNWAVIRKYSTSSGVISTVCPTNYTVNPVFSAGSCSGDGKFDTGITDIAFDSANSTIYVSSGSAPLWRIQSINLNTMMIAEVAQSNYSIQALALNIDTTLLYASKTCIMKADLTSNDSTVFVGNCDEAGSRDGNALDARFGLITRISVDKSNGRLLVVDQGNNRIRTLGLVSMTVTTGSSSSTGASTSSDISSSTAKVISSSSSSSTGTSTLSGSSISSSTPSTTTVTSSSSSSSTGTSTSSGSSISSSSTASTTTVISSSSASASSSSTSSSNTQYSSSSSSSTYTNSSTGPTYNNHAATTSFSLSTFSLFLISVLLVFLYN